MAEKQKRQEGKQSAHLSDSRDAQCVSIPKHLTYGNVDLAWYVRLSRNAVLAAEGDLKHIHFFHHNIVHY